MGEDAQEQQSFFGLKNFWRGKVAYFENYNRFLKSDPALPSWSDSDVETFIASDPVHGPTLMAARKAAKIAAAGGIIGAASTTVVAWKYSRVPHGAALALGAGAVFGFTFGQEIANHWLQLYRMDTMAAQGKFLEWWQSKAQGRSEGWS